MSSDFNKILVMDDRLMCSDKINYQVFKSGQNITVQKYNAISQGPSQATFNVQVPSENVVLSRLVPWTSTVRLKFSAVVPAGQLPMQYGLTDALAPFPLHQMCSTQQMSINNNTVAQNTTDIMPYLSRVFTKAEQQKYSGLCPVMPDNYGSYSDAVGQLNNPLGSFGNTTTNSLPPRGSYTVNSIYRLDGGTRRPLIPGDGTTTLTWYVEFTSTEYFMLSPLQWCKSVSNNQGFYGITNLNVVMNFSSTPSRVWRSSNPWMQTAPDNTVTPATAAPLTLTIDSVTNTALYITQITPHPSLLLPSRNVIGYMQFPRYISQQSGVVTNYAYTPSVTDSSGNVVSAFLNPDQGGGQLFSTINLQLNQTPDKLILFVRKALSQQGPVDADCSLAIRSISINYANNSGILSTASPYDLWRMSVEAGVNQSWEEFFGVAQQTDATGNISYVPTCGSILALDFGRHIQINDDMVAAGSLGNTQLQVNLYCQNQFADSNKYPKMYNNKDWEIVAITVLSGCYSIERGTASAYSGLLTRADVVSATEQTPVSLSSHQRLVGSGFMDSLKAVASKVLPVVKTIGNVASGALGALPDPRAQALSKGIGVGSNVLENLGYGRSAGGVSGGRHHLQHKLQ